MDGKSSSIIVEGGTHLRIAAHGGGNDLLETIVRPNRLSAGRVQVVENSCEAITALLSMGGPVPPELPAGILHELAQTFRDGTDRTAQQGFQGPCSPDLHPNFRCDAAGRID